MENATQALVIVGAVFLALIVLSIGVLLHGKLNQTSESYVTRLDTVELQKYNSKFLIYEDRNNLTAQDIVTARGIAKERDVGTRVFLKNEDITDWNDSQINDFLSKNILLDKAGHTENIFRCKNIDYDEEGMVISIIFEKIY